MAVDTLARTLAAGMGQNVTDVKNAMTEMEAEFETMKAMVGTPLVAATASAMTDHNKIYVYVKSPAESGYTTGHWYYWNGSAWADGGVYNSQGLETDTTLSVSGMAADAKVTGDDITDLKNALQDNYSPIDINWTIGGYIDRDTGDVEPYQTWKYSGFIDISGLTNGYFMSIKLADTAGTSFNCYYNANHEKIDGPFSITSEMRPIPYPLNAKYVRVSANADEPVLLFDDRTPSKIKWYKELGSVNTFVTNTIDVQDPKYHIETSEGHTVSVLSLKEDGTVLNQSNYLGTRDYYRLLDTYKIQLKVHAESGYTIAINSDAVKSITCQPKKIYTPPKFLKIMSMNVGLWGNGTNPMADADVASKSITWHRMLGKYDCDIVTFLEAPNNINAGNNISWSTLVSNKYPYRYNYGNSSAGVKVGSKNAILNPQKLSFQSGSNKVFYKYEYNVADIILTVYVVHLDPAAVSDTRAADIAEVATKLGECDYGIAIGDWNNYTMEEITTPFAGFNICNGGVFGEFVTWPGVTASWPNGAIDNIITTPSISIQNVEIETDVLSDHRGIIAELNLYYT